MKKGRHGAARRAFLSACQKSPSDFPDTLQNAVTFMPHIGIKVLALRAATLAGQGIAGHSI